MDLKPAKKFILLYNLCIIGNYKFVCQLEDSMFLIAAISFCFFGLILATFLVARQFLRAVRDIGSDMHDLSFEHDAQEREEAKL